LPRLEPDSRPSTISPEAAEELAALGYVSGSSGSKARHIDAKDQIHVWNQIERAVDLESTKPAETIAILEQARKWDPDNPMVLGFLAQKYAEANRLPEAKKILSTVIAREPENTLALHRMAVVCLQSGQPAEAIKWAETLQKLDKSNADAWILLARAHIKLGEIPGHSEFDYSSEDRSLDVDLRVDLGTLHSKQADRGSQEAV
jgi:predicted Zn-dependent protease